MTAASEEPVLYGRWRILEVNGTSMRSLAGRAGSEASVWFTRDGYGGDSGCNGFRGLGLLVGNRWFAEPPMASQRGCGDYTQHESAIFRNLAGGPTIAWDGPDVAVLRTAGASLRLRRIGTAPEQRRLGAAELLAGTRWDLVALDGRAIELPGERHPARLTFEADSWTLETPCATRTGPWQQLEGAVMLEGGLPVARSCRPALWPSDALVRALTARLYYVVGPNGEIVLAGGTHWATGRRDVTFTRGEGQILSGLWRVVSVDGAAPPSSERPAELAFGPGAYAVWDGCRHSEGVAIFLDRQLFARGSGVVTLANCPPDEVRNKISRIASARPRIARTADGGIALMSQSGTLRLTRTSSRSFGTGVAKRLQAGMAFELASGAAPPARLMIGPADRFTVALGCGTFDGRWRNDRGFTGDYVRFGPGRSPAGCGDDPTAARLYSFFTGDVHVAVGPNRDIALFVNRGDSLPARLVPPAARSFR